MILLKLGPPPNCVKFATSLLYRTSGSQSLVGANLLLACSAENKKKGESFEISAGLSAKGAY